MGPMICHIKKDDPWFDYIVLRQYMSIKYIFFYNLYRNLMGFMCKMLHKNLSPEIFNCIDWCACCWGHLSQQKTDWFPSPFFHSLVPHSARLHQPPRQASSSSGVRSRSAPSISIPASRIVRASPRRRGSSAPLLGLYTPVSK